MDAHEDSADRLVGLPLTETAGATGAVAYPTKTAAALSGATVDQLRYWRSARTGPLLVPEVRAAPRALYSFRDVLALRTFVQLRTDASLQKIRAAIGALRAIGEVHHLASYRLVCDRAGNIQLVTDDEVVSLGRNRGQLQLLAVIGECFEPIAVRAVPAPHLLRPRLAEAYYRKIAGPDLHGSREVAPPATASQPLILSVADARLRT
jgi:DNA-binding transcriptional MerR regulator